MINYYDLLVQRKKELSIAIQKAQKAISMAPEGRLRAEKTATSVHYYLVSDATSLCGNYIPLSNVSLISELANKAYAAKLVKYAEQEIEDINYVLRRNNNGKAEKVFDTMNEYRKPYVSPILLSPQEYARRWMEKRYNINPYKPEERIYETDRGEFVRSKSEMVIANIYNDMGVPYRYESEIRLSNGGVRYPDFVALKVSTGEEFYHEHFGIMDDFYYRNDALRKIHEYSENGIVLGKNFYVTFEGQGSALFSRDIRSLIKNNLLS